MENHPIPEALPLWTKVAIQALTTLVMASAPVIWRAAQLETQIEGVKNQLITVREDVREIRSVLLKAGTNVHP